MNSIPAGCHCCSCKGPLTWRHQQQIQSSSSSNTTAAAAGPEAGTSKKITATFSACPATRHPINIASCIPHTDGVWMTTTSTGPQDA